MKKKKTIYIYVKRKYLVLIFFAFLFIIGIYYFNQEQTLVDIEINTNCSCLINFGKPECIEGKQYIPFYNPSNIEVDRIKLTAKKFNGYDIYNVDKLLEPDKTETLQLFKCYTTDEMKISWCCNDSCCEVPITAYSKEVVLVK